MASGDFHVNVNVHDPNNLLQPGNALVGGFGGGGIAYGGYGTLDATYTTPRFCEHEMSDELELEDGRIAGACSRCGERILGRRMVGGLGLARLKAALVDALGDLDALPGLADELERVEMMLELEEQSLDDARRLIATAKRMISALMVREDATVE